MLRPSPRTLAAGAALALLAALAVLPVAAATSDVDPVQPACPLLPLWNATWCLVGVTFVLVNALYVFVTCDVIGGPACGFDVCEDLRICSDTTA